MKRLLLLLAILLSSFSFSQDGIVLSQESANEKGITPIWPKCANASRQTPAQCFDQKLRKHIFATFEYPEVAVPLGLTGTVTVEFIVNQKGKVEVIEVTGAHRYLQQEAIRMIRAIPKMKPAKWGNKPISVAYSVPITFRKPQ
ncbi:energy transducer TonB [Aquimarina gracilis]|uniref:Energy transducer TonB n=1 Tax=Aquimarina gracilis TaxID=874422 RepID=A0ABU5ZPZ9_9FLAO|nr:energy transducer TonB [Aquimarina gracilis]MEB3344014.1 energy transducer TonB [Aquimarina gracilis]